MSGKCAVYVALALCSAAITPAAAENLQGYAKGLTSRQISLTQNGAPLLQSFYTRFTNTDHHFAGLEVMPNAPAANQASILYTDKNGDDEYFYNITFAPYFGDIFRRFSTEFCRQNTCTYPVETPPDRENYVFVLRGFYISFRGGDHHIDQVKISEQNGRVTYALNDKNDDDPFRVDLSYAYIPRSQISAVASRSGNAKGGQRMSIEAGTPVIRGFNFDFRSSDHHIQDIGIVMNGNAQMEVYYGDKNKDDPFDWSVDYGILGGGGPVSPVVPPVQPLPPLPTR
jgi:hypothetical protein